MTDCLFCKIISGQIPAKKVYEDDKILAFLDINPRNPGHTLVVPKKHSEEIFEISEKEAAELFKVVKKVADMVKSGMNAQGLNITQSNGKVAGQIIKHLHFHVIPRYASEGPVSLEAILPVKRMDEASLDRIVSMIKQGKSEKQKIEKKEEIEEIEEDFIEDDDSDFKFA